MVANFTYLLIYKYFVDIPFVFFNVRTVLDMQVIRSIVALLMKIPDSYFAISETS